ncbi:carbohydrate kinase [Planctomycetota bacterium]|nr:carbohydrate kinase [Planctomycetota bacterium]
MTSAILAIDLGAESGRIMRGRQPAPGAPISEELEEIHRFPTGPHPVGGTVRWDLPRIAAAIDDGLAKAAAQGPVSSLGIDTWGVDYVLVDDRGEPLELPWHHRDARTHGLELPVPAAERFSRTGVAPSPINTLNQLVAHRRADPAIFDRAAAIQFIGDALHRRLCGGPPRVEHSIAGTSELLRAGTAVWDGELAERSGIPARLLPPVVAAGTVLGELRPEHARRLGFTQPPRIITPAVHDTASAASCVASGAYLSSGTWSLLGITIDRPILTQTALELGFSNETAADGRVRLNRNIMGLWLVQECRRAFAAAGRDRDYAALTALAESAPSPAALLDVDDARFLAAAGAPMPERIAGWYRERGHAAPADDGAIIRAVLEGLAKAYAKAVAGLAVITGAAVPRLTIIGGGVRNRLLLDLTRKACSIPVDAGPAEATALGNLRSQLGARRNAAT